MKGLSLITRFLTVFGILLAVFTSPTRGAATVTIRHVTTDGGATGDCSSMTWANPCTLQYALSIAQPGDEIWVKVGTYHPSSSGDRSAAFMLKDNIAVYGGFVGNETNRVDRRWQMNRTTLSGDLSGNDSGKAQWDNPSYAENSYHVVTAEGVSSNTILDGFTIRGGNANGGAFGRFPLSGGGISLVDSSPVLNNLIISGNTADDTGNGGGLLLSDYACKPWLTNVLFNGNWAGNLGGAIDNYEGSPVFTNVTFSGNHAVNNGGAMSTRMGTIQIRNSIFWGNTASNDPAISIRFTFLTLTNSDIQGACPSGGPPGMCDETNLYIDPSFVDADGADGIYGTADDNLRLGEGSQVINKGSNLVANPGLPAVDLDGSLRVSGGTVDMGAYEWQGEEPPVSRNQVFYLRRDTAMAARLFAVDPNGDSVTFALSGNAPAGTFQFQNNGSFTYTPVPSFTGSVSFQFTVKDTQSGPVGPFTATIKVGFPLFEPMLQR